MIWFDCGALMNARCRDGGSPIPDTTHGPEMMLTSTVSQQLHAAGANSPGPGIDTDSE